MANYMVPVDEEFVEEIAKAIAKERFEAELSSQVQAAIKNMGVDAQQLNGFENTIDRVFERMWGSNNPQDEEQKSLYRKDAQVAIRAINLKLLTATN